MIFQYHILYRKLGCCWRKKKKKTQENDGGSRLISSRHYINYNKQTHQKKGSKELVSLSLFFFFFSNSVCWEGRIGHLETGQNINVDRDVEKPFFFVFFFFGPNQQDIRCITQKGTIGGHVLLCSTTPFAFHYNMKDSERWPGWTKGRAYIYYTPKGFFSFLSKY